MKKYILIPILLLFGIASVEARVRKVNIDLNGNFDLVLQVGFYGFVIVDSQGEIRDIRIDGNISYSDKEGSNGKVRKIGAVNFTYFDKWTPKNDSANRGKLAQVGSVEIKYYDSSNAETNDANRGKIAEIGDVKFEYYGQQTNKTNDDNRGKVAKIGSVDVKYYDQLYKKTDEVNRGKVAEIGGQKYTYFDKWDTRTNEENRGMLSSGKMAFSQGGLAFLVIGEWG